MIKKEKVIIYPFDIEFCQLLRNKDCLENFEIVGLVSPSGWGFCGEDAGMADRGENINITVSDSFNDLILRCDTVFFWESYLKQDIKKDIYPKILRAIELKRNIVCAINLNDDLFTDVYNRAEKAGIYFKYYVRKSSQRNFNINEENLYDIKVPVIFVLGVTERTHKFYIQLLLRREFQTRGYKVSQIGSKHFCEMLGFHSFPDFMYSCSISEVQKIVLFNRFVKKIEYEEKPDIIIIGIPGGIMPINKTLTNKFGIFAYEVSQAVIPDAVILGTLYEDYYPHYFELMSQTTKFKLGFDIDCFNLSNNQIDWNYFHETKKMEFITLDSKFIDKKVNMLKNKNVKVYNVLNPKDGKDMAGMLINLLEGSEEAECI